MVKNERHARWLERAYQQRLTEGLCTACGVERDRTDRKLCARCRDVRRRNSKQWREKCERENRCTNCGDPKEPQATGQMCLECAMRNYYKTIYHKR